MPWGRGAPQRAARAAKALLPVMTAAQRRLSQGPGPLEIACLRESAIMRQDGALVPFVEFDMHIRMEEPPVVFVVSCSVLDSTFFHQAWIPSAAGAPALPGRSDRRWREAPGASSGAMCRKEWGISVSVPLL